MKPKRSSIWPTKKLWGDIRRLSSPMGKKAAMCNIRCCRVQTPASAANHNDTGSRKRQPIISASSPMANSAPRKVAGCSRCRAVKASQPGLSIRSSPNHNAESIESMPRGAG